MRKEDVIIGGEESNGLTIHKHVPEKDGIIACLLVVEMVAGTRKNIKTLLKELTAKTGTFYNTRKDFRLTEERRQKLLKKFQSFRFKKIGRYKVKEIKKTDGYKFILGEDTWIMARFSGTEPIVRLYSEAKSKKVLNDILKEGKKLILN